MAKALDRSTPREGTRGVGLTLAGLAAGWGLAAVAARLLTALLYGFQPSYSRIAVAVSVLLLAVAALACFVPAHRASRIDPVMALRNEYAAELRAFTST